MQQRKAVQRMCCGCGEMKPKQELIRVVRSPEREDGSADISLDPTGKMPGRGAYVCRSSECLRAVRKKKRLEKALSCAVASCVYDALEKEMDGK